MLDLIDDDDPAARITWRQNESCSCPCALRGESMPRAERNRYLCLEKENVVIVPSPVAALKAIKNSTEVEGFRQCHIRDGVALARYFAWLEEQLNNGVVLNESQGSDKLEEFRSCVMRSTLDSFV